MEMEEIIRGITREGLGKGIKQTKGMGEGIMPIKVGTIQTKEGII
jgi:hypothetical protein